MTVVSERGTMPSRSARLSHPRRLVAAGDQAQGALLSRGEAERRETLGLRTAQPLRQPVELVSELHRVLVVRSLREPDDLAHASIVPGAVLILRLEQL